MIKDENLKNLEKCPRFNFCSANICPLDFYVNQRTYIKGEDVCPFTIKKRDKFQRRLKLRMPDSILKVVPKSNVKMLNKRNLKRWHALHQKDEEK